MIVFWTAAARGDRRAIRRTIADHDIRAAIAMDDRFTEKAQLLVDNPKIGRNGRLPGTRELVVHASYLLVYDLTPTTVRILRVMHTARAWPPG